jgi:hypothetical protein
MKTFLRSAWMLLKNFGGVLICIAVLLWFLITEGWRTSEKGWQ